MTALEQLRAAQHDDRIVDSDVDLERFLSSRDISTVLADLEPQSAAERKLVERARSAA